MGGIFASFLCLKKNQVPHEKYNGGFPAFACLQDRDPTNLKAFSSRCELVLSVIRYIEDGRYDILIYCKVPVASYSRGPSGETLHPLVGCRLELGCGNKLH